MGFRAADKAAVTEMMYTTEERVVIIVRAGDVKNRVSGLK